MNEPISCRSPSSEISKSDFVRSRTGSPLRSRTTTSTRIALTVVGAPAFAWAGGGVGCCDRPASPIDPVRKIKTATEEK